ncbi:DUF4349 domain-containing protein [Lewinella sp. LCG006]|uniref:DUF4349 domain-containing protein n=1 Tax=Lewinella sp. LCG006 TaxID=3231911 RepID=UPI00345FC42B
MRPFKTRLRNTVIGFGLLFLLLVIARLIYGYVYYPENEITYYDGSNGSVAQSVSRMDNLMVNVASSSYEYKKADVSQAQAPTTVQVDQKYEKTANISASSTAFSEDEASIKAAIEKENGIIQYQQKSGNEGSRKLSLQIGIPPTAFDGFVAHLQANYKINSISIVKTDKTNEYRELNAKRLTLSNTRQSLMELKAKGGKIEEYISLENRILEIDGQLQALGVQLGSFDAENEFCTVKLDLTERRVREVSFTSRLRTAFTWAIEQYFMFIGMLLLTTAAAFFSLKIWDWVKEKM